MNNNHFFVISCKTTNFGDCLTKIFFETLSKKSVILSKNKNIEHYISVGSIIGKANHNSIVMGSGAMEKHTRINNVKEILWVRGPLTRNNLLKSNIECPEKYGDPFILFPLIYNNTNSLIKYDIGFIPHTNDKFSDKYKDLVKELSINKKIIEIDINLKNKNYKDFIDKVLNCDVIIASSLHAVIIAIVYNKKTIYTTFGGLVSEYKFKDFFESLKINYKKLDYNDPKLLDNIIKINFLKVKNIGISMIKLIPFIDDFRKSELINEWEQYCKNVN